MKGHGFRRADRAPGRCRAGAGTACYVGGTKVDKLIRKKTKSCNAKKEETASTQGERGCGLKSCSQAARRHARKVYSSGLTSLCTACSPELASGPNQAGLGKQVLFGVFRVSPAREIRNAEEQLGLQLRGQAALIGNQSVQSPVA